MLHAPKWRTKMFHRTVAGFWNIYSNTSDSLALDFFKTKDLKATCHQSYSFWPSPTGPNQLPSKSHFAKNFNHQNLLSNCCVYSFTHIYECEYTDTHFPNLYRGGRYLKTENKSRICRGSPKASYLTGTPWVATASPLSHALSDKMELEKGPNCLKTHSKAEKDTSHFFRAT